MTGIEYEKAVVALICWKQMKGELYRGMSYMAMMLRNRAKAGWFDGSIYFNAVAVARESEMKLEDFPDARELQFQNILQAMDGIFSDVTPDRTGGAMYVAHASSVETLAGEITTQVGQYIFFRGLP